MFSIILFVKERPKERLIVAATVMAVVLVYLAAPHLAEAAGNWALRFDGSDDYVYIPHSDELSPTEAITISAWFKPLAYPDFNLPTIYAKGDWSKYVWLLVYNEPGWENVFWCEGTYFGSRYVENVIQLNQVYYGVVTYNGQYIKMYLNGSEVFSLNYPGSLAISSQPANIGSFPGESSDYRFNGIIDEVRVYNRAISLTEVQQQYQGVYSNNTGLVGLWHFDEGSGDSAADSSGNNNTGTVYGGATWVPGIVPAPSEDGEVPTGGGLRNKDPQVVLKKPAPGVVWSGKKEIIYTASDPDTGTGALKANPITIFYSQDGGSTWQEVASNLPNTSSYTFDSTKVPDSTNAKIRVVAFDGYNYFNDDISEPFTVDNTGPTFDIVVSPAKVKEKDTITLTITSSEALKTAPQLTISQAGTEAKEVAVKGEGKQFSAAYEVVRGYSGEAVLSISGEDLAGNVGKTINSGGSFLVARYGPPPPTIKAPLNNQSISEPVISLSGTSQPAVKLVLTLNNTEKYSAATLSDGSFLIEGIKLSEADKGYNTLSIVGINKLNEESEAVVLKVKLNQPPEILLTTSFAKEISGEKEINWTASDLNDDALVFSVECSSDGGLSWSEVVSEFSTTTYLFDTSQFADGDNYLLKITADDGTGKTSILSEKFAIENGLIHIALDMPLNYFTNTNPPVITGKATGVGATIAAVNYSLDEGVSWQEANPLDGMFNALIERFKIAIPQPFKEGKYTILVKAEDITGSSVKISRALNIDTSPPAAPVILTPSLEEALNDSMDTNEALTGLQFVLKGKGEAGSDVLFTLEGKTYHTAIDKTGTFVIEDVTLLLHGANKFSLLSTDAAGNSSEITNTLLWNNPPRIVIESPQEGGLLAKKGEISWFVKDSDDDGLVSVLLYQEENKAWAYLAKDIATSKVLSNTYQWDVSALSSSQGKLKVVVSDGISQSSASLDVVVDNVAPQIAFDIAQANLMAHLRPAFSGQASDDFSGIEDVEYSFNNTDWYKALITEGYRTIKASFKFRHRFSLPDGDYQVSIRATDRAGNVAGIESFNFAIDTTSPRFGSYLIYSGALVLFPNQQGIVELFENTQYNILVAVAQEAQSVSLRSGETIFDLSFNRATQLWQSQFNFSEPGIYPLILHTEDKLNNSRTKQIATLEALPQGKVFDARNQKPIEGAEITLYIFDQSTNRWLKWDGAAFNQMNPQKTSKLGEYSFLVPPGKYRLEILTTRFGRARSEEIELAKNYLINVDVPLEKLGLFKRMANYFRG